MGYDPLSAGFDVEVRVVSLEQAEMGVRAEGIETVVILSRRCFL